MTGKLRVGIIGSGAIALQIHAPGYLALPDDCELVACCDVVPERAKAFAERFATAQWFTDYHEMLALPELDAVSVCTPPFMHRDATVAALDAGKHVLCEKPMAMNVAEAKDMASAAERAGKVLTIGHQQRFSPEAQAVKRAVEAGELGDIYYAKTAALRSRGAPTWGVFHVKKLNGGGPLIDIGVHALDVTLWLMGNPRPVAVFGATYMALAHQPGLQNRWGKINVEEYDVEDLAAAFVRFDNGATLVLETSWLLQMTERGVVHTQLFGTEGSARLDPFQIVHDVDGVPEDVTPELPRPEPAPAQQAKGDAEAKKDQLQETPKPKASATQVRHAEDAPAGTKGTPTGEDDTWRRQPAVGRFVQAALGRVEPLVKPEETLNVQRVMDALYQSAESGQLAEITD